MITITKEDAFTFGNIFLMSCGPQGENQQARNCAIAMYGLAAKDGHDGAQGMYDMLMEYKIEGDTI